MICYRDQTFCSFYDTCKQGGICVRALTPEIREAAKQKKLPLSQFVDPPEECYEEIEEAK